MIKLKPIDYEIISELIKNPRLSDRQLARILKTSQPTVTRRRVELEKENFLEYTAIPNLKKLGFEILAFTFANWNHQDQPNTHAEEMKKFVMEHPNIIFVSTGSGLGWDRVGISVHRDYNDFCNTVGRYKTDWGKYFTNLSSFLVSFESDNIFRNITFKCLSEVIKENCSEKERK